ncbi:MAG TPA: guanylate kinase [Candidatus Moranbacteria bacterium]|nr:guanylate kinase [Candidatus Moranbacteria bacterium]
MANQLRNLFIISGPSGVGEDSVIEGLRSYFEIERVITTTTRSMRPGESEGKPYFFVEAKEFEAKIKRGDLAEYAQEYNGNYYGVTKDELYRVGNSGKIGIWKIEYKGVMTVKQKFPWIKSIYIAPPSLEVLESRIRRRDGDVDEETLKERMEYTKEWIKHEHIYDYKVVNEEGELAATIQQVAEIIKNLSKL